eukprot:TRINITY_DN2531_c0_g1_i2.p1 TRINITY_DN2531_c0_g1~~TRINITY_DN2531_c0_g1_i2.p1  ORF type:complete len:606 (-),score=90.28 TRINITY_DN2531_c0_g1_i2:45-1862(-)
MQYRIKMVTCGNSHTLCLTEGGDLFSWGRGDSGQLGFGTEFDYCEPRLLESLINETITYITSGSDFNIAITKNNVMYSWGSNTNGQLGVGTQSDEWKPAIISTFNNINIVKVHSAWRHSLAISDEGIVYGWGINNYGQLGLGYTSVAEVKPQIVKLLLGYKVIDIACGWRHSIFLTEHGDVYCCGVSKYGQCGIVSKTVIEPHIVLSHSGIRSIVAGGEHSLAHLVDHYNHPLCLDFIKIYRESEVYDTIFIIGTNEISAHKYVLMSRSTVFSDMFKNISSSELSEIIVDLGEEDQDFMYKIYDKFLEFVYTDNIRNTLDIKSSYMLYDMSVKYGFERLGEICVASIEGIYRPLPATTLKSDMRKCLETNNREYSDIIFISDDDENISINAHSSLLLIRCPNMCETFSIRPYPIGEEVIIVVDQCSFDNFRTIMSYIYHDNRMFRMSEVAELLVASSKLNVKMVKEICEGRCATLVNSQNVLEFMEKARDCNALRLKNRCIQYIVDNFQEVLTLHPDLESIQEISEIKSLMPVETTSEKVASMFSSIAERAAKKREEFANSVAESRENLINSERTQVLFQKKEEFANSMKEKKQSFFGRFFRDDE